MGIPTFFRWLSNKYPRIMSNVIEEIPDETLGVPVDSSLPNPNQVEIDNLYLDMNGIIHPCCHPEDKPAPETEDEMYIEIFKYIDRIFNMIRPRKVLYMAIDGVAPRAKMNQQRSRRFRAAREEQMKIASEERTRLEMLANGLEVPAKKKNHFDSNCITPGTPFMEQLAVCLRYYITDRLNNNPGWAGINVILSDSGVPGEGEHKIMDFIRHQKMKNDYNPDTKHCLYGLDADLIMLALATHEPQFWILREDVSFKNKSRACETCGQTGHASYQCRGAAKQRIGKYDDQSKFIDQKPFVFVHISVLREYLEIELKVLDISFEWSIERAIDDWIFMCFFVGNDFLPHLPSLEIREGAIENLISIWKNMVKQWSGYLTDSGDISLARAQSVLEALGEVEDGVFVKRREDEEARRLARLDRKRKNKERQNRFNQPTNENYNAEREQVDQLMRQAEDLPNSPALRPLGKRKHDEPKELQAKPFSHRAAPAENNKEAAKKLKMMIANKTKLQLEKPPEALYSMEEFAAVNSNSISTEVDVKERGEFAVPNRMESVKSSSTKLMLSSTESPAPSTAADSELETQDESSTGEHAIAKDSDEEPPEDNVRLWESGWKARYYESKFFVDVGDEKFRNKVVQSYVEGLVWVLKYYYQGVQSWKWYYPYHYSPFASDFKNIEKLTIQFEKSMPFKPIEQLMGVFPAASKQHIPKCFHHLMEDESSPVIDFYPVDFPIDLNGKKYEWQGVALLPFIDADRLLDAMMPFYKQLTPEEEKRNSTGSEVLFAASTHPLFDDLCAVYHAGAPDRIIINTRKSRGMAGTIFKDELVNFPGSQYLSPLREFGLDNIENKESISVFYELPKAHQGYIFRAQLLSRAVVPPRDLRPEDVQAVRLQGHESNSRGRGGRRGMLRISRFGLRLGDRPNGDTSRKDNYLDNRGVYTQPQRSGYEHRPAMQVNETYMGGGGYANRNSDGRIISNRGNQPSRNQQHDRSSNESRSKYNSGYSRSNNVRQDDRLRNDTRNYSGDHYLNSSSTQRSYSNIYHQNSSGPYRNSGNQYNQGSRHNQNFNSNRLNGNQRHYQQQSSTASNNGANNSAAVVANLLSLLPGNAPPKNFDQQHDRL